MVRLATGALAVTHLTARPLATVQIAPVGHPTVLAHLRDHHAAGLAACLRARGHDAHWVEPRSLDAAGLDVLAVGPDGVELVRLAFPAPVSRLQDLRAGLAVALTCRCAGDQASRTEP
jgi:hypothetical protein